MSDPAIFTSIALQIADDTNYDVESDPYDGTPLKVAPSLGLIKQGLWRPGHQIGAQSQNFVNNQFAQIQQALIDGLYDTAMVPVYTEFLVDDTITIPDNALSFGFTGGFGGGGGGGGGADGDTTLTRGMCGGGGGGGAVEQFRVIPLVPGDYAIQVGDPGSAGARDTPFGHAGDDGQDSKVTRVTGSVDVAIFRGAAGGLGGEYPSKDSQYAMTWAFGGMSVKPTLQTPPAQTYDDGGNGFWYGASSGASSGVLTYPDYFIQIDPQQGAYGKTWNVDLAVNRRAGCSPQGFLGGTSGSKGTALGGGGMFAGGGGGGGAGGPRGNGVAGGIGGNGNDAGNGTNGAGPSAPAANLGCGGGGGGGGGSASGTPGFGGQGSSGSSGFVWLIYFVPVFGP